MIIANVIKKIKYANVYVTLIKIAQIAMVHCRIYGILKVMRRCNDVADSGEILFSGALLKRVD